MRGRHVILTCPGYQGWEYGMLRCLEAEIQRQTGATVLEIPKRDLMGNRWLQKKLEHGTRYECLRSLLPKKKLQMPANVDVFWCVLMGPENYELDLYEWPWQRVPKRVIYLFDTLPRQMERIQRLFSGEEWNFPITSFEDAVPLLEKVTHRQWHHIDQAVSLEYFMHNTSKEIAFSSYGRRHPKLHEALLTFCQKKSIFYDYTMHGRSAPTAEPLELYRQYAWHMSQSQFTVGWPVEITNPERAGGLRPITCRWFEAAAAGATVIGQAPKNPRFSQLFGEEMVLPFDPTAEISDLVHGLERIWAERDSLLQKGEQRRRRLGHGIDWSDRVQKILQQLNFSRP
ncbi:glycosyltransferase family 1 protein [bacterium]|nr:glycosyltransferase family 1 protein [bacterium]